MTPRFLWDLCHSRQIFSAGHIAEPVFCSIVTTLQQREGLKAYAVGSVRSVNLRCLIVARVIPARVGGG
jgi:hypothetical protein